MHETKITKKNILLDSTQFSESIDIKITKIGVVVQKILNYKDWMNFCLKTEKQKIVG